MAFDDKHAGDPGATMDAATGDGRPLLSTGVAGEPPGRHGAGADVEIGEQLGAYRIERRLGAGGMGEVFAARHLASDERCALKVLGRVNPTALYRFKREFRALADVAHPNLISLRELVVPSEGAPFFTMELIDGVPFTDYVRGRTPAGHLPNLVRLARALRQLIAGLHHLHLAQCLHRDVKPSNVMVTREGRVVILDFGLVSELAGGDEGLTHDGALLGTPAYMAPEQAMAGKAGPAADYYAVGVMLYECLTGELPFKGTSLQVMMHKQDGEIPDPRAKVAEVPDTLRELCMRLLARDPERRPGSRELLGELDEHMPSSDSGSSSGAGTGSHPVIGSASSLASASLTAAGIGGARAPFIGRKRELSELDMALRDVEEARSAITVHVHGASGYGKSALLTRFLARVRRKHDALLLSGRCLERESVPYKGVDAIIDALSLHLRRLSTVEVGALQSRNIAALTRIFPVLGDVWDKQGPGPGRGPDAAEQRRLGLMALRELLVRLSDRRPLLICIDDFQWADIDSVRLLITLMRPPDPPTMLVLLGFRDDLELRREALDELTEAAALAGRDVRELRLGPMLEQDALDLTLQLMGDDADPAQAQAVVERAGANPFFIGQMVLGRHQDGGGELGLDEIVARRIVDLDPEVREVLAAVAIAGGPLPHGALLELLEIEAPNSLEGTIDELCALGLLVRVRADSSASGLTTGAARLSLLELDERALDTAHGRIRQVVISELEIGEQQALHLRLAAVLERLGADLETLAEHFARGGEAERAADYTERAAIAAAEALAFARAVELYERTLELLPATAPGAKRRGLRLELARQLVNLGHGAAAAEILLELAVVAKPDEARALHRRAAEQLLRTGRLDEGLDLSRGLLEEVGEPMPKGFWGAVWMIVKERARLWIAQRLHGVAPKLRREVEIPPQLLARLDIISIIATGLSLQDIMLTQALQARGQYLAYQAGEPRRLGLMLSYKAAAEAAVGNLDAADRGLIDCRELAAGVDDLELELAIDLAEAMIDWFAPRMPLARRRLARLMRRLEESPGADWIRAFAAIRYAETCILSGRLAEVRREMPRWLTTAREHGNLHELASLSGLAATMSLYYDDLEAARRHLESGREIWAATRYTIPDLTLDLSAVNVHLVAGDLEAGFAQVAATAGHIRVSGLANLAVIRDHVSQARDRCTTRAALRAPGDGKRIAALRQACKHHHRYRDPLYRGEAQIHEAALHSLTGDREAMRRCWRAAEVAFDHHDQAAMLAAVRLRLAEVTRGREAAEYREAAEAYLRAQGIGNGSRLIDWLAPRHG